MHYNVYISQDISNKTVMQAVNERTRIFNEYVEHYGSQLYESELMKDVWYNQMSKADVVLIPNNYKDNKWTEIEAKIAMAHGMKIYMYKIGDNFVSVDKYNYTRSN